jgi:membrane protease YdiL (CAAX protease family)
VQSPGARPDRPLREALVAFAVATALSAALYQLGRAVPFVGDNLQAFIAAIFIYLPVWLTRRRGLDIADYGFRWRPLARGLAFAGASVALAFPLFLIGFALFYATVCGGGLDELAPPGFCARWQGWPSAWRGPAELPGAILAQLVVVALPEELFFRGFLLGRLEEALPPRRRLLGGGVGRALLLSALLFALGHVLVDGNPRRLAVFFPGLLFGWLRSATGSILAGTLVHAAANLYIEALQRSFFS